MTRKMVRYKVKPGRAAENERYIERVFEQLRREQPRGLRYASFKLEDGLTFVHLVETTGEGMALSEFTAFKDFAAAVRERCEEAPVTVEFTQVGSYRVFGE